MSLCDVHSGATTCRRQPRHRVIVCVAGAQLPRREAPQRGREPTEQDEGGEEGGLPWGAGREGPGGTRVCEGDAAATAEGGAGRGGQEGAGGGAEVRGVLKGGEGRRGEGGEGRGRQEGAGGGTEVRGGLRGGGKEGSGGGEEIQITDTDTLPLTAYRSYSSLMDEDNMTSNEVGHCVLILVT